METCTIKITVEDKSDHYHEEDVVKNIWPYMVPWFTRRHGVEHGEIRLGEGVKIEWKYDTTDEQTE